MEADDELPLSEEERARRAARELLAEIGKKLLRRVWGTGWRRDEGRECGSVGRAEAHPEVRSVWFITFNMSAIFRLFSSQQHANILPIFRPKVANMQHQPGSLQP